MKQNFADCSKCKIQASCSPYQEGEELDDSTMPIVKCPLYKAGLEVPKPNFEEVLK